MADWLIFLTIFRIYQNKPRKRAVKVCRFLSKSFLTCGYLALAKSMSQFLLSSKIILWL